MRKIFPVLLIVTMVGGMLVIILFQKAPKISAIFEPSVDLGTYAYSCDDDTKFLLNISYDMQTVRVIPSGSSTKIPEMTMQWVAGSYGTQYQWGDYTLFGKGETVIVVSELLDRICSPVTNPNEAPFNFGD